MSTGVHGSGFEAMAQLREKVRGIGSGQFFARASKAGARLAEAEVQMGFDQQRDPYGNPWAPSNGFGLTMQSTGRLRDHFDSRATMTGFEIVNDLKYAAQRQYGGKIEAKNAPYLKFQVPVSARIAFVKGGEYSRYKRKQGLQGYAKQWVQVKSVTQPARPMVPEGELGPIWGPAFDEEFRRVMREFLGR